MLNRKERRQLGMQTVEIVERGSYETADRTVAVDAARCVAATIEYTNESVAPQYPKPGRDTLIEVTTETSLAAARRLAHRDVAVLNFASAKNPGGGFLNGSRAQEESLAMSSALYACLQGRQMYAFHRPTRGGMYTPWVIYSPHVPVFRGDDGALLDEPYEVGFLTSPAVNAGVVLEREPGRRDDVLEQMQTRITKVLSVAAHHEHPTIVLGAWGCGVFRNDPADVADLFAQALEGPFAGVFEHVVFAIVDWSAQKRFVGPFERRLGSASSGVE